MKIHIVVILSFLNLIFGQQENVENAINSIFNSDNTTDFLNDFEEVAPPKLESLAALAKCGEGDDVNKLVCVPYYNCDPKTNTVKESGINDGSNVIDIRFGENKKCDHYLDVCCQVSNQGTVSATPSPDATSNRPVAKTTTERLPSRTPTRRRSSRTTEIPQNPTGTNRTQGTTLRNPQSSCGIRNPKGIDFQITGNNNNEAEFGEFPWMVAILKKKQGANERLAICGGSIITPIVILTGAHCVRNFKENEIKIRAGEWDTQTEKERIPYQERNVYRIVLHEDFVPLTLYNDVALLILDRPLSKTESIGTICLPSQDQRLVSSNCFATGWGKDVFGQKGQYSVILKKIQLPMVQHNDCQRALRNTRLGISFVLHKSFTCAGGEAGVDTCTGDGGSPLVCQDPKNPNRYLQAGIVAWGIGCGEMEVPGVYADVPQFRNWIDQKLEEMNINSSPYIF